MAAGATGGHAVWRGCVRRRDRVRAGTHQEVCEVMAEHNGAGGMRTASQGIHDSSRMFVWP